VQSEELRRARRELEESRRQFTRSEQALLRRLEFERFLFELSRTFIGFPEEEVAVNMERGLGRVGEFLAMDRVTLTELSRDRAEMTVAYTWSAPGVPAVARVIGKETLPWWISQVRRGQLSLTSNVDDLPEDAALEKQYLHQGGVTSAASIPLKVGGEYSGAISFVTLHRHVTWTEELVNQLRAIGDIFWNALRRRQAMQALLAAQHVERESEERFRLAMSNVPSGVYTVDLNGMVTYVNPAAEAMFGWTNAELLGRKMHDITHYKHPDGTPYPASECPGVQILERDVELREHQDVFIRRDGSFFPVVLSASPLKKDGTTVGFVVGFRDDTERREAERAMREREGLRASEERYRELAEQVVDGIIITSAEGRPLDANRAACDLLGYTLDELRALGPEDLLSAEEIPRVQEMFRRPAGWRIVREELRLKRKDGSVFTAEVRGRRLRDGRLQAVVRDVTERKETEEVQRRLHQLAMMPLEANLKEVLGAIVEVAIDVAHADFGNIQLLNPESLDLRIAAHRGFPTWWIDYWQAAPKGKGAGGTALAERERVIVEDVEQSPIFSESDLEMHRRAGVRAVQSTPLVSRTGKFIGMLSTHFRKPCRPSARTLSLLDLLAREAADIIGYTQAEAELKRQAALLDLAHNSILVRDEESRIRYWNEGAVRSYGWSREEALGQATHTFLQTQFPEPFERIAEVLTRTGHWQGELVQTCRDGRRITVDSRWALLYDAEGAGHRILEINNDITARKQAEAALRESEQQLQSYIDQAGDAIYVLDGESGRILNANARAVQMLGYSRDELLRMSAADIECEHAEERIREAHQAVTERVTEVEGTHRRKDGSQFPVDLRLTSLEPSSTHRVLALVRDISERRRLEQERADEARRKDEFLAFLGHELRNPLAAIHTAIQVLTAGPQSALRTRMEETIGRQTSLMRRLVDDLLELERITHGQIDLRLEPVELAECLQLAAAAVNSTVAGRHQELVLRLPSEPVRFMADSARLEQIVGNLLTNASKYTGPGGRIELSGVHEGADVIVRCKDNGQGIVPEHQREIFKPFARAPRSELGYGEASVGLGLALVKQLTELHGGTVSVESAGAGLGSEFTVRFPLVAPPSDRAALEASNAPRSDRSPCTIAIVEDNPSVAETLKAALEQVGHTVHVFGDGPSALAALSDLTPDAFVIDVGLPGMDGYELAAALQERGSTKDVLRIAVSGFKPRNGVDGGEHFDYYFNKPVDVPAILEILDNDRHAD
jgi:PAS domain S-box-containing protein